MTDSPNALNTKGNAREGYQGGGISKKLIALVAGGLFLVLILIFYVIGQKGQKNVESTSEPETQATQIEPELNNKSDGGLEEVLNAAPQEAIVKPKPPTTQVPRTQAIPEPKQTDSQRREQLAYEQEVQRINQRKVQALQQALFSQSAVAFELDEPAQPTHQNAPKNALSSLEVPNDRMQESDPNKQDVKQAFSGQTRRNSYLIAGREKPLSPYELKVGTLIPATMISGVNSDLPGQVIASVSQNVYDSATGSHLLLPQGSKLYGVYDSQIAYGQSRVLMAWTRVNYPDGTTLELEGMGAIDSEGFAGFEDQVDHHYWKIFGNAFILGMITGATEAGISDSNSDETSTAESINNGVTQQFAETGSTLIEKNLDVQPTIVIRNGYKFNIMLNKDVVLHPYQPL
ncbi:TrbI/VirB10 family protein [Vibrio owensii]|uniref:TrbI/VirB10 family protein n=1 Tax=Vibrio owensii TaxID=696485 RepID=UPI0038CE2539